MSPTSSASAISTQSATESATGTVTATPTAEATKTATATMSPTSSASATSTESGSVTATEPPTQNTTTTTTETQSTSPSGTSSATAANTSSRTKSGTPAPTQNAAASPLTTSTSTPSSSASVTARASQQASENETNTATQTAAVVVPPPDSGSGTPTRSPTPSTTGESVAGVSNQHNSGVNIPAAVGGSLGTVAALFLIGLLLLYIVRERQKKADMNARAVVSSEGPDGARGEGDGTFPPVDNPMRTVPVDTTPAVGAAYRIAVTDVGAAAEAAAVANAAPAPSTPPRQMRALSIALQPSGGVPYTPTLSRRNPPLSMAASRQRSPEWATDVRRQLGPAPRVRGRIAAGGAAATYVIPEEAARSTSSEHSTVDALPTPASLHRSVDAASVTHINSRRGSVGSGSADSSSPTGGR